MRLPDVVQRALVDVLDWASDRCYDLDNLAYLVGTRLGQLATSLERKRQPTPWTPFGPDGRLRPGLTQEGWHQVGAVKEELK